MRLICIGLALSFCAGCGSQEPYFLSVLKPSDTTNAIGPYRIETYVVTPNGVGRLLARFTGEEGSDLFSEEIFLQSEPGNDAAVWFVEIPGMPSGSEIFYYLLLTDENGALVRHPADAPVSLHRFRVLEPLNPF